MITIEDIIVERDGKLLTYWKYQRTIWGGYHDFENGKMQSFSVFISKNPIQDFVDHLNFITT
jgi:hypothetical protein